MPIGAVPCPVVCVVRGEWCVYIEKNVYNSIVIPYRNYAYVWKKRGHGNSRQRLALTPCDRLRCVMPVPVAADSFVFANARARMCVCVYAADGSLCALPCYRERGMDNQADQALRVSRAEKKKMKENR